jgi:hypothetical protein
MERGTALNLFEVHLPSSPIPVMSKPWDRTEELQSELRKQMLPAMLFASHETDKLYAYGISAAEKSKQHGFTAGSFDPDTDPRFAGRLIADAIVHHLVITLDFELQLRPYVAKVYEVTDVKNPLQRVAGRLDVYPSYRIQSVFLKIAGELRYFLMINPKVRYRFVHTLAQIHQRVDCTGRFVRVGCPANCNVYDCKLYDFRGRLAGKLTSLTGSSSFRCRFAELNSTNSQFVQLDERSRLDFSLPIEVCELEASPSNINTILSQRFNRARASKIISDLRVLSGDLVPTQPRPSINTAVGQRRWADVMSLVNRLDGGVTLFEGPAITIEQEPVRAVEGGFAPEDLFFERGTEEEEVLEDETDVDAF